MFFYNGYSCPTCQKPFTETDDIVVCPHCGLPHHRDCWAKEGHCHLEHLHNTPEQWSRTNTKADSCSDDVSPENSAPHGQICPRCHTQNPEFAEICTHCGMELLTDAWRNGAQPQHTYSEYQPYHYAPFTTSNVNPGEEIDGVKAEHLAATVNSKADYYLPRFRRMFRTGNNTSWNWAAFLLGPFWLMYRKMYGLGALVIFVQLLQSAMTLFVATATGIYNVTTYEEMYRLIEEAMFSPSYMYYFIAIWLSSILMLVIRFALAAFGNRLYLQHCTKKIKRALSKTHDLTAGELSSLGGTSVAMAIIGYIAQYFITEIIAFFFI